MNVKFAIEHEETGERHGGVVEVGRTGPATAQQKVERRQVVAEMLRAAADGVERGEADSVILGYRTVPLSGVGDLKGPLTLDALTDALLTFSTQRDHHGHPLSAPRRYELAVGSAQAELNARRLLGLPGIPEVNALVAVEDIRRDADLPADGWELRAVVPEQTAAEG